MRKQIENLKICDRLAKQIKPVYGPNITFCADYETEFSTN